MQLVYEKQYKIRWYEIDYRGKVQINAILNYMQDIAGDHAHILKFGVRDLFKQNLTWILSRYHIRFHAFPRYGQAVIIKTWPSKMENRFALRDFEARDEKGNIIFQASSSWLLFHLLKKRPVRVSEQFPGFQAHLQRAVDTDFPSLPGITADGDALPFRVRLADLDINQHVNNVVYIQWAIESMPREILTQKELRELQVSYRREAKFGDRVQSAIQKEDGDDAIFLHRLSLESTGKELTRLITRWE